jgi:hypothetical protein
MDNLEIIILSTMITTLFAIFIGLTARELSKAPQMIKASDESGPRANLTKFMGKLFDTPVLTKEESDKKINVYNSVIKTIADMESDGVYFPDEVKKELYKKREELWCEYSNLPSVKAYESSDFH